MLAQFQSYLKKSTRNISELHQDFNTQKQVAELRHRIREHFMNTK